MSRIREGWWPMLALCVACGLWFFMMPLLGYGYEIDGVWLRPGWFGVPPCVFGAVFAARNARGGVIAATLAGLALFAITFQIGIQFQVMRATHTAPCVLLDSAWSCQRAERFDLAAAGWDPVAALDDLRSPLEIRTFVQRAP